MKKAKIYRKIYVKKANFIFVTSLKEARAKIMKENIFERNVLVGLN